jgi:hypothetical protein
MSEEVRCVRWNHPLCPKCKHRLPHEKSRGCGDWSECVDRKGDPLPFKVRCVKHKEEGSR